MASFVGAMSSCQLTIQSTTINSSTILSQFIYGENCSEAAFENRWRLQKRKRQLIFSLMTLNREYYRGKYHCTIHLLFDQFGLICFVNKKNKKIVSSHTADSKPVKQEVNGTVILSHLVFPALNISDQYLSVHFIPFALSNKFCVKHQHDFTRYKAKQIPKSTKSTSGQVSPS